MPSQYISFNGDSAHTTTDVAWSFPEDFTIAFKIKVEQFDSGDNLLPVMSLGEFQGGNKRCILTAYGGGDTYSALYVAITDSFGDFSDHVTDFVNVGNSEWNVITVIKVGDTITVYSGPGNTIPVQTRQVNTSTTTTIETPSSFAIHGATSGGIVYPTSTAFDYDDVMLVERALTQGEIDAWHNSQIPVADATVAFTFNGDVVGERQSLPSPAPYTLSSGGTIVVIPETEYPVNDPVSVLESYSRAGSVWHREFIDGILATPIFPLSHIKGRFDDVAIADSFTVEISGEVITLSRDISDRVEAIGQWRARFPTNTIDTTQFTDSFIAVVSTIRFVMDSITATDEVIGEWGKLRTISDRISVMETYIVLKTLLRESMDTLLITTVDEEDNVTKTYVYNPLAEALTEYTEHEFQGYCTTQSGVHSYGVREDGVYKLGGPTDDGAPIKATLGLPSLDFGSSQLKNLDKIYVGTTDVDGVDTMILRVQSDNQLDVEYLVVDQEQGLHTTTVDIGRGQLGRYWKLTVSMETMKQVDIDSIEFTPLVHRRRR